jgi:NhaP-type Na+/H+ or K+/H+ antiporter
VLIWGGLRGAVALALALSVAQSDVLPKETGNQILFLCAGIVVLTILINGGSFRWVLTKLGLSELPPAKQATVDKARQRIDLAISDMVVDLKDNDLMSYAQWETIEKDLDIKQNPTDASITGATDEDLDVAFRRRLLESERKHYWQMYNEGILSRQAVKVLVSLVEEALDGEPQITPREGLERHWRFAKTLEIWSHTPIIKTLSKSLTFSHLKMNYDIARGFLLAQQTLLSDMAKIAPNEAMLKQVQQEVEQNISTIKANIEQIRQGFPDIVSQLETFVASRLLLNKKRNIIKQLAQSGVLDNPEAERLTGEVEQQMQALK